MKLLGEALARLYRSEINVSISTFWDGGWDVKLGDEMNGFVAETTIHCPSTVELGLQRTLDDVAVGLTNVAGWLHEAALEHFPDSQYALESSPSPSSV